MKRAGIVIGLMLVSLLFVGFVWLRPALQKNGSSLFAERVNLALRRTAHHLLTDAGDTTSRILPVKQLETTIFQLQIGHSFDYERLPTLLQESFRQYQINDNYTVAVLDCSTGEIQLGYTVQDLLDNKSVPCMGRQQGKGCYTLQVTFATVAPTAGPLVSGWLIGISCLLAVGGYVAWQWTTRKPVPVRIIDAAIPPAGSIQFGQFSFNRDNQTLVVGTTQQTLTYREAKLLNLFATHPNQLLERDFILKSVWEDEGITVGRSVDVFVSRLRKLLRYDPAIQLVAVHGVGYRLEVGVAVKE